MMAKPAARKGRPQKTRKSSRLTRHDHLPPAPRPEIRRRRSLRSRRPRQVADDDDCDFDREEEEEEEDEERVLKKLRLVVKLPRSPAGRESARVGRPRRAAPVAAVPSTSSSSSSASPASSSSSSYAEDEEPEEDGDEDEQTVKPPKKRRIDRCAASSDAAAGRSGLHEEGKKNAVGRSLDNVTGNLPALHSGTLMPDKKELELILDKLQKKDTYGAFAEPVDPEELPDYHDVIEHPMDFGTVRKKLIKGAYHSFEQFEDDVFLICSNAMQYNAPDTIYFRQARAIQDVARRKFQDIRDSMKCSETEQRYEEQDKLKSIEKKTPPTLCKPVPEPLVSDISSGATPASAAETCTAPSAVIGVEKSGTISGVLDGNSSLGESKQEKTDDFSAKCSPSRIGRKIALVDENRRATYNVSLDEQPAVESDFVLSVFEDEQKRLVPVGPDAKHLYAKSLARFAGSFGPIAWKIASKSIEKVLPAGMKFGPGWVGEYEPPPATFLTHLNQNQRLSKSEICHARTDVNEKVPEMKNAEQNLKSSSKQSGLKNQINTAAPTKASHPGKGITYDDPRGRKAVFFGVSSSAEARVSETGPQMQNLNSNSMNCGFMNQMSNGISCGASIHVKEESPSEEPTDNRQAIFLSNDRTPPSTGINSPQLGNQSAVEFTKAPTIASRPSQISNPSSKLTKSSFRGNFLRDSNYMPSEMQQQLEANSFQRGNNALGMAIEEMNNETRLNNPMSFFSINQTGVKDGIGRGNNHNQTSNDPFKFAVSSGNLNQQNSPTTSVSKLNHRGKMSNQQNCSSSGIGNLNQSMPSILPMSRENCSPATSAAARAWMSVGTSATWKSANGKHTSDNPVWNTPTSASHINGDFMIRPGNLPIQVFNEASHDRNKGLVIFPQLIPTDLLKFQSHPLWQGLSPRPQTKQRDNLPPDLNIGYQPPGSPVQPSPSVMDSQQPDLALQL